MTTQTEKNTKIFEGLVVSTKMDKTVVVEVIRMFKDKKYGKYIRRSKRYKAHDADNSCVVGQKVAIHEVKPISKDKSFIVVK